MTDTQKEDSKLLYNFYIGLFALWPTLLLTSTLGFLTLLFQPRPHQAPLGPLYAPVTGIIMGVFIWASSYCMARMVGAYNVMSKAISEEHKSSDPTKQAKPQDPTEKDPLSFIGLGETIGKHPLTVSIIALAVPATLYTLLLIAYYPGTSEVLAASATILVTVAATLVAYCITPKKH